MAILPLPKHWIFLIATGLCGAMASPSAAQPEAAKPENAAFAPVAGAVAPIHDDDIPAALIQGSIQKLGRRIWSILGTIEREHFDPPARVRMLRVIVHAIVFKEEIPQSAPRVQAIWPKYSQLHPASKSQTSSADDALLSSLTEALNQCLTADEFATEFAGIFEKHRLGRRAADAEDRILLALRSVVGTLEITPKKEFDVQAQFRGNRYVGLGVHLGQEKVEDKPAPHFKFTFSRIVPGGPASRAGLKDGTAVLNVNGHDTTKMSIQELVDAIRGPVGTDVRLVIQDPGSDRSRDLTISRGFVRFDSVLDRNSNPLSQLPELEQVEQQPIGWFTIPNISSSTVAELRDAELKVRSQGLRVLIFDFRGFGRSDDLHEARLLADSLLSGGTLWSSSNRQGETEQATADRECLFRQLPLVILVSSHTPHSLCAVAAALQDNGRGTIVGSSPRFDGKVATSRPLPEALEMLLLTTHRITRAAPNSTWPLVPDHQVPQTEPPSSIAIDSLRNVRRKAIANSTLERRLRLQKSITPRTSELASALAPENSPDQSANRPKKNLPLRTAFDAFRLMGADYQVLVEQIDSNDPERDGMITTQAPNLTQLEEKLAIQIARDLLTKSAAEDQ